MESVSTGYDPARLRSLALELTTGVSGSDGRLRIGVSGNSMRPTLRKGDSILLRPSSPADLMPGVVITFLTDSGPVTHRIVEANREILVTKGDHSRRLDPPVPVSRVVGVVEALLHGEDLRLLHTGRRTAWIARVSLLEGRITARFKPDVQKSRWVKLVTLPLRILVAVSAYSGLSR